MSLPMLEVSDVVAGAVAALEAAGLAVNVAGQASNVRTPSVAVVGPPSAQWPDQSLSLAGDPVDPLWTVPVYVLAGSGDRAHLADAYTTASAAVRALADAGYAPDTLEPATYADAPAYVLTVNL